MLSRLYQRVINWFAKKQPRYLLVIYEKNSEGHKCFVEYLDYLTRISILVALTKHEKDIDADIISMGCYDLEFFNKLKMGVPFIIDENRFILIQES